MYDPARELSSPATRTRAAEPRESTAMVELARNLKVDSVSRLHPTPPRVVTPDQSIASVAALMRQHRVGCVVVCRGEELIGLFTERDLMRRVLAAGKPLDTPVADCMT